jgi:hypothetical protein
LNTTSDELAGFGFGMDCGMECSQDQVYPLIVAENATRQQAGRDGHSRQRDEMDVIQN